MMVQSPLELYTTFLGFKYYDLIWTVCSRFGIAYLPFLMLMVNSLTKPFETAIGNGADISFRRTFIEFILMTLVCYLAVAPAYHLDVKEIKYRPVCHVGAQLSRPGNSGTTYDDMFQGMVVDSVKVPLLLGLALGVSSGITYAVTQSMPCTQNINHIMHAVVLTRFSQPLQNKIQQFNNQCYLPAKAMFNMRNPDPSSYQSVMKQYGGNSDLSWMGSHVLSFLYYQNMRANQPVAPFPYALYRSPLVDHNLKAGLQERPTNGYPTCKQWWSNQQYGLEKEIIKEVNNTAPRNAHLSALPLTDRVVSWLHEIHAPFTSSDTADDIVARGALYDASSLQDTHINTGGGLLTHIANIGVTIGQLKNNLITAPMDQAKAQDLLPIVQAILIFLILMFYPFIMIAGNYNLKVLSGLIFLLFSLIFTTAIWHALTTLQDMINNSMSYVNFQNPEEKPVFNNFFTTLYYVVPLFFNSLIAGTGVLLGDKLNQMSGKISATSNGSSNSGSSSGGGSAGNSSGNASEAGEGISEAADAAGAAVLL
jgi:hypothetical protein